MNRQSSTTTKAAARKSTRKKGKNAYKLNVDHQQAVFSMKEKLEVFRNPQFHEDMRKVVAQYEAWLEFQAQGKRANVIYLKDRKVK